MEAYPLAIRRKIIVLYDQGWNTERIAEFFGYCVAGVRRVRQTLRESGSIEPKPWNAGRRPRLNHRQRQRLGELVSQQPDATLAELRDRLGVDCDLATICRSLRRLGLARKKSRSTPASRSVRT
jgi:transposase